MKQSINFCESSSLPDETYLVFSQMVRLTIFFVIFLILFASYDFISYSFHNYIYGKTQAKLDQIELEMSNFTQKNTKITNETRQRISLLKKELHSYQHLSSILHDVKDYTKGFSAYMNVLTYNRVENLWITSLKIDTKQSYINIGGQTTNDESIPRLIKSLSDDAEFSGKSFKKLKIVRNKDNEGVLDFIITGENTANETTIDRDEIDRNVQQREN